MRIREPIELVRIARSQNDIAVVSACCRGAVVLCVAAMERYLNQAVEQACHRFAVASWSVLAPGHRAFICKQMAQRLSDRTNVMLREAMPKPSRQQDLKADVMMCAEAFANPSTWQYFPGVGMLGEGHLGVDRIDAILRNYDQANRSVLDYLEMCGGDRSRISRDLASAIDARHAAAHALVNTAPPSPGDALGWMVSIIDFVRKVDAFLGL